VAPVLGRQCRAGLRGSEKPTYSFTVCGVGVCVWCVKAYVLFYCVCVCVVCVVCETKAQYFNISDICYARGLSQEHVCLLTFMPNKLCIIVLLLYILCLSHPRYATDTPQCPRASQLSLARV
jgi:hypothetical protein